MRRLARLPCCGVTVYYLEVCVYSQMCSNREELFRLNIGDVWRCEMDQVGYNELREWVLRGPA